MLDVGLSDCIENIVVSYVSKRHVLIAAFPKSMTAPTPAGASALNLRVLLEEVIERGASDLHISAGERPMLRIDGDMTRSNIDFTMQPKDTLQLAYSVLTEN